jgi:hypothetical protein
VIRCRQTTWALVAVAAAALAGRAGASSIASYQLENTGTTTVTQILAEINPAGSVFAPTDQNLNPLKIITTPSGPTGTSVSSGFDPVGPTADQAIDHIGTGTLANGDPLQVLDLQFDSRGFTPGAVMNFSLTLTAGDAAPTLTLIDPTTGLPATGLSLVPFTAAASSTGGSGTTTTPTGGGSTPSNNVPEPATLALWSVIAGLGMLRARAFRRGRRIEV